MTAKECSSAGSQDTWLLPQTLERERGLGGRARLWDLHTWARTQPPEPWQWPLRAGRGPRQLGAGVGRWGPRCRPSCKAADCVHSLCMSVPGVLAQGPFATGPRPAGRRGVGHLVLQLFLAGTQYHVGPAGFTKHFICRAVITTGTKAQHPPPTRPRMTCQGKAAVCSAMGTEQGAKTWLGANPRLGSPPPLHLSPSPDPDSPPAAGYKPGVQAASPI